MPRLVADYAFDRPSLSALKAAGVEGVARYLAPMPNGKVLNTNPDTEQFDGVELAELARLEMSLVVVWETTPSRATQGFQAGATDAQRSNAQADELGLPANRPLYYAVDSDYAYPGAVKSYFDGVRSVPGREVGIYGSYRICQAAQADGIKWAWQTVAWSNGQLLQSAHLYQRNYHSVDVPGTWDENVVLQDDWGQWVPGTTAPIPAPPVPEEDTMAVRYSLPNGEVFATDGVTRRYVANPLDNDVLHDLGVKLVDIDPAKVQAFHDGLVDAHAALDVNALAAAIAADINVKVDAATIASTISRVLGAKLSS